MTALVDANATGNEAGTKSFTYDANGNMTVDGRKGLEMRWNLLNLADSAAMHGSSLTYAWLSNGTKVAAKADDGFGNGARMYDPFAARWTAVDPLAKNTSPFTPYTYCTDNSINQFDPDGNAAHIAIGAIVGAAIEGGIAIYQGKSNREVVGAMIRGAIEGGVIAATFGAGTGAAIAYGTAASAVGSMADQKISNGSIDAKTVVKDAAVGAITGVGEAVVSKGLSRVSSAAKEAIEAKYASSTVQSKLRNEIKRELRNEGKKVKGSTLNQLEKERVSNQCNAENAFVDFVHKTVDYSVQKNINSVVEEIQH